MGTKISWCDESWNPIVGCSKISAGCLNCYAEKMACRLRCINPKSDYSEIISYKPMPAHWNGKTVFVESALTKPLHWRTPRKIFVCSMSDLFHESVPFDWIHEVVAIATYCHHHQFFFLTKRADIMFEYFNQPDLWSHHIPEAMHKHLHHRGIQEPVPGYIDFSAVTHRIIPPLPNLHLGVTVESQDNVGRIADLIRTPAAKRFVSFEPLLEGIEFTTMLHGIDYAFIGCESGPRARLCTLGDIRDMMHLCRDELVMQHIKQIPLNGKCNKNFDEWPPEFQVREV